jgi:hypothetical protein
MSFHSPSIGLKKNNGKQSKAPSQIKPHKVFLIWCTTTGLVDLNSPTNLTKQEKLLRDQSKYHKEVKFRIVSALRRRDWAM